MSIIETDQVPRVPVDADAPAARPSRRILSRMGRQRLTMVAAGFLLVVVLAAIFADVLTPYGEVQQDLQRRLEGPSTDHWLGTDEIGRDTFTRVAFGARVALQAAAQSVLLAAIIGIPIGLLIGYRGGWFDRTTMRIVDVVDSVPGIFLAFAVIAVLGRGLTNAMIAIGLIFVSSYIRLARSITLVEREQPYIDAGRTMGLRTSNILLRQTLPNVASVLVVQTVIFMGRAILIEAGLSFLGLGADAARASWGSMLTEATKYGFEEPALMLAPGLAITLTVLALNLVGDGLRDAMGVREVSRHKVFARRAKPVTASRHASAPPPAESANTHSALAINGLVVRIGRPGLDPLTVVDGVTLNVAPGECVGLVGESGSGKSMTASAAIRLLPDAAYIAAGSIVVGGEDITIAPSRRLRELRGSSIATVFQDPMAALSPVHSIGLHLDQAIRNSTGRSMTRAQRRQRSIELLEMVEFPRPADSLMSYPHQLSGGMAQRVGIALALAGEPQVLIADEPTTALDVTVQLEILKLLTRLRKELGMAILLITHDLGVVAYACDRAHVMYAGQLVESGEIPSLLDAPRHPYTRALRSAVPGGSAPGEPLASIPGRVPPPWDLPPGCRFAPRCELCSSDCVDHPIDLVDGVRCITPIRDPVGASREKL